MLIIGHIGRKLLSNVSPEWYISRNTHSVIAPFPYYWAVDFVGRASV